MRERLVFGISPGFPELSRCQGQVTHAASVRPEPGSNSPSEIVEILRRTRRWRRRRRLRSHLDSTPSRTSRLTILPETSSERMDGTRDQPGAARAGSSVVRMFQVPSLWDNAHQAGARCACPVVTGLKHWLFTQC